MSLITDPCPLARDIVVAAISDPLFLVSRRTFSHLSALHEALHSPRDAELWELLWNLLGDLAGDEIVSRDLDRALRSAAPGVAAHFAPQRTLYPVDYPSARDTMTGAVLVVRRALETP